MSLKQFFKPDWKKILIFVLLAIPEIVPHYAECTGVCPAGADCYPCQEWFTMPLWFAVLLLATQWAQLSTTGISLNFFWIAAFIAINYTVSCLIVFAWERLRGKRK